MRQLDGKVEADRKNGAEAEAVKTHDYRTQPVASRRDYEDHGECDDCSSNQSRTERKQILLCAVQVWSCQEFGDHAGDDQNDGDSRDKAFRLVVRVEDRTDGIHRRVENGVDNAVADQHAHEVFVLQKYLDFRPDSGRFVKLFCSRQLGGWMLRLLAHEDDDQDVY